MATIVTEQAPAAKPVSKSVILTTAYQDIIVVDDYDVPIVGFASDRRIAPGVAEISSPLILSNTTGTTHSASVRIQRGGQAFTIINDVLIEPNEVVYIPLNGQFLLSETNDILQAESDSVGAIHAMISFTQGQAEEDNILGDT
jgi:hypothetical protein